MKILLCANYNKQKTHDVIGNVIAALAKYEIEVINDPEKIDICDALITVGGDGTILSWGKVAAAAGKPLLGINTGTLGFMATLESNELDLLRHLITGEYRISRRMMLNISIRDKIYHALNDVVFHKNTFAKLPEFSVTSSGVEVSRIRADGLIFSTPTGSTAYALSAGGPIIEPELECVQFTPLCAHTLFGRPMILTGSHEIKVCYKTHSGESVHVSVDGDEGIAISEDEAVTIGKSDLYLDLIDFSENSFYYAVDKKLMKPMK